MVRAWRTYDFRAVFHLACKVGLTPEMIAVTTGLPLDLVLNVMKGNATLSRDPAASEPVAAGLGMPGDIRGIVGLPLPPQSRVPVPLTKPKDAPARRPESAPTATLRLRESVGDRIAKLRRQRGLTQEQLAEQAGISLTMISKLEQQARTPSLAMLDSVAQALDVPASYFLQPGPHKGQPGRRNQRPPDHLPAEILSKPDFIAACETRDLGTVFQIAASHGFMRSHLARRCEMTVGQVSAYILGARKAQDVDIFCRVSDGLHIPGAMLGIGQREWETSNPPHASRQSEAHPADPDEESGLPADTRTCSRCDRPLSRYNNADYCGSCSFTGDRASQSGASAALSDIGPRLRAARQRRGITLDVLAGLCGLSAAYLSMVENGKRPLDRYSIIVNLADALNISPAEIAPAMHDEKPADSPALQVAEPPPAPAIPAGEDTVHDDRLTREISAFEAREMPIDSPRPAPNTIVLNLRIDGKEMAVPTSRNLLLQAGVSSFVKTFALDQQFDMVHDTMQYPRQAERLTIASPAHLDEVLIYLREQWHTLVKTDNLLGPRFALAGVLNQISVVEALRLILRDEQRIEVARIGAKYAESAAWLYEETDNLTYAHSWTSQAMEWAYEGNDERMLAWTIFRRAQQAAAVSDAPQTIGLAQAARRHEEKLATPTRAAIRIQEAYGHALDGNDQAAQGLLDEAHTYAASDTTGDAREGHGSYCTPDYIEIQRATCWLATGQPKKAISLYEDNLRTLPTVYQGNRAAALTRLAVAYATDSQPEQAANTAHAALPVARSAGSMRIVGEIKKVGAELIPYRALPAVAVLLDELESEDY